MLCSDCLKPEPRAGNRSNTSPGSASDPPNWQKHFRSFEHCLDGTPGVVCVPETFDALGGLLLRHSDMVLYSMYLTPMARRFFGCRIVSFCRPDYALPLRLMLSNCIYDYKVGNP